MNILEVLKRDLRIKPKQLRGNGFVPATISGGKYKDGLNIQIYEGDVKKLFRENREGSKLTIKVDDELIPVQIKEKAVSPLMGEILHVDFQALEADHKVNSVIDIILENEDVVTAPLEKMMMRIPYSAYPADMIDTVTVNMEGIEPGTILTVGDIKEINNDKIELQVPAESIVLRILG